MHIKPVSPPQCHHPRVKPPGGPETLPKGRSKRAQQAMPFEGDALPALSGVLVTLTDAEFAQRYPKFAGWYKQRWL